MNDNDCPPPDSPGKSRPWSFQRIRQCWIPLGMLSVLGGLVFLLTPSISGRPDSPPRRTQCKFNLINIAKAVQLYHDSNGRFPPPFTVDSAGNRLHSWRTLILPHIEQQQLYDKIDLTKPWNDPANKLAYDTEIPCFRCPSLKGPKGHTTYLTIVGEDACFHTTQRRTEGDIKDGVSHTIMLVEATEKQSVHWMDPTDADEQLLIAILREGKVSHANGVHVAFADCAVTFLPRGMDAATLHSLVTIDGKDNHGVNRW